MHAQMDGGEKKNGEHYWLHWADRDEQRMILWATDLFESIDYVDKSISFIKISVKSNI